MVFEADSFPDREERTHTTGRLIVHVLRVNGRVERVSVARFLDQREEAPGVADLDRSEARNLRGILEDEGL